MMFIPGHVCGAYLFIVALETLRKKRFELRRYIFYGVVAGVLLDIDYFITPLFGIPSHLHHEFVIHTPIFWVIAFLILYPLFRYVHHSILPYVAGISSHLVLDSLGEGLMLAYPLSTNFYGLNLPGQTTEPLASWVLHNLTNPYMLIPELAILTIAVVVAHRNGDLRLMDSYYRRFIVWTKSKMHRESD